MNKVIRIKLHWEAKYRLYRVLNYAYEAWREELIMKGDEYDDAVTDLLDQLKTLRLSPATKKMVSQKRQMVYEAPVEVAAKAAQFVKRCITDRPSLETTPGEDGKSIGKERVRRPGPKLSAWTLHALAMLALHMEYPSPAYNQGEKQKPAPVQEAGMWWVDY